MDYLNDNHQVCGLYTNVLFLVAALTQNKIVSFNKFKRVSIHLNIIFLCCKIFHWPDHRFAQQDSLLFLWWSVVLQEPLDMTHRKILLLIQRWPLVCKKVDPLYSLEPQICMMFKLIESQQFAKEPSPSYMQTSIIVISTSSMKNIQYYCPYSTSSSRFRLKKAVALFKTVRMDRWWALSAKKHPCCCH